MDKYDANEEYEEIEGFNVDYEDDNDGYDGDDSNYFIQADYNEEGEEQYNEDEYDDDPANYGEPADYSKRTGKVRGGNVKHTPRKNKPTTNKTSPILFIAIGLVLVVLSGNLLSGIAGKFKQSKNTEEIIETIYFEPAEDNQGELLDSGSPDTFLVNDKKVDLIMASKERRVDGNQLNYYITGITTNSKQNIKVKVTRTQYNYIQEYDLVKIEYEMESDGDRDYIINQRLTKKWKESLDGLRNEAMESDEDDTDGDD